MIGLKDISFAFSLDLLTKFSSLHWSNSPFDLVSKVAWSDIAWRYQLTFLAVSFFYFLIVISVLIGYNSLHLVGISDDALRATFPVVKEIRIGYRAWISRKTKSVRWEFAVGNAVDDTEVVVLSPLWSGLISFKADWLNQIKTIRIWPILFSLKFKHDIQFGRYGPFPGPGAMDHFVIRC